MLRVFHHWCSQRKVGLFFFELSMVAAACLAGTLWATRGIAPGLSRGAWPLLVAAVCGLAFQGCLYLGDMYDLKVATEDRSRGIRVLRTLAAAVLLSTVAIIVASFAIPMLLPSGALLGGVAGATAAVMATRVALPLVVGHPTRLLIVGAGQRARQVAAAVEREGERSFDVVGFVDDALAARGTEGTAARVEGAVLAGHVDELCERTRAELIVVALEDRRGQLPVEGLLRCRMKGVRIYDAPAFMERVMRKLPVPHLRASDLIYASGTFRQHGLNAFLKRSIDLSASLLLTILASPLMLVTAILIKLDSKGPVFYSQERTGKDGKPFLITKFRTMRTDAEKEGRPVWAKANDDRVTRIGRFLRKTRVDEIPQVLAVLRGDMSFVGPRPERPFFVEQLKTQIPYYGLREAVKPGITGWAQIRYPYGASVEDAQNKLEYDLYYMKNWSLFLDVSIIFHTVRHVLFGRGAR